MYKLGMYTLLRDEDHIILEWIIHHLLIGFEHIYIFDDLSKNDLKKMISELPLPFRNQVSVYKITTDFNDFSTFTQSQWFDIEIYNRLRQKSKQQYFMNYFLEYFKNEVDWCFFGDCDEFFWLQDGYSFDKMLSDLNDFHVIYFPWVMYGSSYHIEQPNGLIIDNFRYHSPSYHLFGKALGKMSILHNITCIHDLQVMEKNYFRFNSSSPIFEYPIHLNHYQINSVKTFLRRKLRYEIGWQGLQRRSPQEIISTIISFNEIYDTSMQKYVEPIKKILYHNKKYSLNIIEPIKWKNTNLVNSYILCNDNELVKINEINEYQDIQDLIDSKNLLYKNISDIIPNDFDPIIYKNINPDLYHLSEQELINHYINYGMEEERIYKENQSKPPNKIIPPNKNIPEDFNPSTYKLLHLDLKDFSDKEAINHYIKYGKKEGRKYILDIIPKDFNPIVYRNINSDLHHLSEPELISHYIHYGIIEKRNYK